jgi:3-hydroxybutyryl-CoA dehydratase
VNRYQWEDISLGLKHSFDAVFTSETMEQFAAISGDRNPLHVDAAYATQQGFPSPVIFGLMSSSLYSQLVGMYLPGQYALLQGIDIDFHKPCFAGEPLNVQGEVAYLNEAYRRFEIKAQIRKADRSLVSKSTIRVGFHGVS